MPDFILITSKQQFYDETDRVWREHTPERRNHPIGAPSNMPYLASIFIANGMVSSVILDKKTAKRLVYSKTNKYRTGSRWFDWLEGNLEEKIGSYIDGVLAQHRLNRRAPLQAERINEVTNKAAGVKGPALITQRLYGIEDTTVADFFLVTRDTASKLVYCNKNIKREEIAVPHDGVHWVIHDQMPVDTEVPIDMPEPPSRIVDNLISIMVLIGGKAFISTLNKFDRQTDIPRFTNAVENDLLVWEGTYISEINAELNNLDVTTEASIGIAGRKSREFIKRRKEIRADYTVRYREAWTNEAEAGSADPEIYTMIQRANM